MAIPVYLWLKDDGGADIKGSVDVKDREGSIEVVAQEHNLYIPTDNNTGKLTGTRIHTPFLFTKEIDSSSPYLYKAVTTGQTLKSAEFKWYKINDAGQEVEYFNTKLENVKLVKVHRKCTTSRMPPSRSITTLSRSNCATKKSPGPTKTATSFIPIPGTNAPRRKTWRADPFCPPFCFAPHSACQTDALQSSLTIYRHEPYGHRLTARGGSVPEQEGTTWNIIQQSCYDDLTLIAPEHWRGRLLYVRPVRMQKSRLSTGC
jgi:type VI secretion system secreted protein Hcp